MKILVTGFNPFNNQKENPSLEVLNALDEHYNGHEIRKVNLDVMYHLDANKVIENIKEFNPDLVLLFGEAGGRRSISLEYDALNMESATIPDNKGELILHHEIIEGAPLAYKTNLDVLKISDKMKDYKFSISYHAGTYICNEIYFSALDYIYSNKLNTKCGFVHFPFLTSQTVDKYKGYFSMEKDEMVVTIYHLIDVINEI